MIGNHPSSRRPTASLSSPALTPTPCITRRETSASCRNKCSMGSTLLFQQWLLLCEARRLSCTAVSRTRLVLVPCWGFCVNLTFSLPFIAAAVSRTPQSMHDGFEKAMANLNGLHLRNEQGKFELPPASAVTPAAAKMPQTALQQSGMFEQLEGRAFQRAWESVSRLLVR